MLHPMFMLVLEEDIGDIEDIWGHNQSLSRVPTKGSVKAKQGDIGPCPGYVQDMSRTSATKPLLSSML